MERPLKKLTVGKTYKDRNGLKVTIIKELPKEYRENFIGEFIKSFNKYNPIIDMWEQIDVKEEKAYQLNGGWGYTPNHLDLIEEIPQ